MASPLTKHFLLQWLSFFPTTLHGRGYNPNIWKGGKADHKTLSGLPNGPLLISGRIRINIQIRVGKSLRLPPEVIT